MSAGHAFKAALGGGPAIIPSPIFTGDPFIVFDSYPSPATAGFEIDLNGDIQSFDSGGPGPVIGKWDPSGTLTRADYDFRCDVTTGGDFDGTYKKDIWYPGTTLISFLVSVPSPIALHRIIGTLRMRPTGGGVDIDTAPINLEVDLT
jgi:hypothetical protein